MDGGPTNNYDSFKVASNFFIRLRKEGVDMDDPKKPKQPLGYQGSMVGMSNMNSMNMTQNRKGSVVEKGSFFNLKVDNH